MTALGFQTGALSGGGSGVGGAKTSNIPGLPSGITLSPWRRSYVGKHESSKVNVCVNENAQPFALNGTHILEVGAKTDNNNLKLYEYCHNCLGLRNLKGEFFGMGAPCHSGKPFHTTTGVHV